MRLEPRLGLAEATAIALGAMIGAGVYVAIGEAARVTGGSLLLAVLLGAFVATLNGLSSAELGVDDPRAGGAYQFSYHLIGPVVGFLAGWLFVLAGLAAAATYALTFAAYLGPLAPTISPRVLSSVLVLVATALNAVEIRVSARASVALVAVNVGILLAFVVLATPLVSLAHFRPFFIAGVGGVLQAGALLFFAFTGYARPVTIVEEIQNPRDVLPRAVTAAIGLTTLLYLAVSLAAVGAGGSQALGRVSAPLRAVMSITGGVGPILMSLGALVATVTVMLTEIWGLSRLVFAMARNSDFPGWFGQLFPPGAVPRRAILVVGAVLLVLTSLVDLRRALEASSLALLIYYAIMNVSALRLPPERRLYPSVIPAAGLLTCALLALSLPATTVSVVFAAALVGLLYLAIYRATRRRG